MGLLDDLDDSDFEGVESLVRKPIKKVSNDGVGALRRSVSDEIKLSRKRGLIGGAVINPPTKDSVADSQSKHSHAEIKHPQQGGATIDQPNRGGAENDLADRLNLRSPAIIDQPAISGATINHPDSHATFDQPHGLHSGGAEFNPPSNSLAIIDQPAQGHAEINHPKQGGATIDQPNRGGAKNDRADNRTIQSSAISATDPNNHTSNVVATELFKSIPSLNNDQFKKSDNVLLNSSGISNSSDISESEIQKQGGADIKHPSNSPAIIDQPAQGHAKINHPKQGGATFDQPNRGSAVIDRAERLNLRSPAIINQPATSGATINHPASHTTFDQPQIKSRDDLYQHSYYTRLCWSLIPNILTMSPNVAKIYLFMLRRSVGFHRSETNQPLSPSYLQKACGLSRNTVREALRELQAKGLIKAIKEVVFLGTIYQVFHPEFNKDILEVIKEKVREDSRGHFVLFNEFFELIPFLPQGTCLTYLYFYSESIALGSQITQKTISLKVTADLLQTAERTIRNDCNFLIENKIIERRERVKNDGWTYYIHTPKEVLQILTSGADLGGAVIDDTLSNSAPAEINQPESNVDKSTLSQSGADLGGAVIDHNEMIEKNKSSSAIFDDDLLLFKKSLNACSQKVISKFNLSDEILNQELEIHGLDKITLHLKALSNYFERDTVSNPVGVWRISLKNPGPYTQYLNSYKKPVKQKDGAPVINPDTIRHQQQRNALDIEWSKLSADEQQVFVNEVQMIFEKEKAEGSIIVPNIAIAVKSIILERAKKLNIERKRA